MTQILESPVENPFAAKGASFFASSVVGKPGVRASAFFLVYRCFSHDIRVDLPNFDAFKQMKTIWLVLILLFELPSYNLQL